MTWHLRQNLYAVPIQARQSFVTLARPTCDRQSAGAALEFPYTCRRTAKEACRTTEPCGGARPGYSRRLCIARQLGQLLRKSGSCECWRHMRGMPSACRWPPGDSEVILSFQSDTAYCTRHDVCCSASLISLAVQMHLELAGLCALGSERPVTLYLASPRLHVRSLYLI